MSMDEDEELLQDFLVEAGEILEQLGEQLVDLENRPQDVELLNAVFRGFHTIKGGGSFLSLDNLVALCHRAEDVFNVLRNGERQVDANVMDVMLPVLDVVNLQFDELRAGDSPQAADPELLKKLESLSVPENDAATDVVEKQIPQQESQITSTASNDAPTARTDDSVSQDEITDEEFESLLDTLDGKNTIPEKNTTAQVEQSGPSPAKALDGDITDDEFEALLDQLPDVRSGEKGSTSTTDDTLFSAADNNQAENDDITEEEFDALLNELDNKKTGNKNNPSKPKNIDAVKQTEVKEKVKVKLENNKQEEVTQKLAAEPNNEVTKLASATAKKADVKNIESSKSSAKSKENPLQAEATVRVDTRRLDDIMNMVGELVLVRNRMATLEVSKNDEEMSKVVANLDVVTADLQAAVMKTRMQPIKKVFGRFPRVVRDLARNLKKEVNLELQGEDTDLDKNLVEALADPLVHLVRNAVDHGIETPQEREANNKPRAGTVVLTAEQEGDHILLTIEDDGKGMDADALRKAAVSKGMLDEEAAARLEPKDCYNLIFQPGFSTKVEISDVSGRGVGMDVVKTRIEQLNGSVEIDSALGKGSVIIIKVPLTLAIMPTLMVMLEQQIFALPLASVNEIFHLDLTHTNTVDGQLVVVVRDKALPLFYLRHWLVKGCYGQELPKEGHVVVVSMGIHKIGFVVDSLIGQEEVVIKPLGALLHGMKGLAGATITGDGRISLILDIPGLMQTYARRM